MILLALDTCEARGSVALLQGAQVLEVLAHESAEEYSSWLPRAVDQLLKAGGHSMQTLEGYAVASGPGSFTGLRVGLTTVKAWGEVFGRPIAAVSRLEALASQAEERAKVVAVFVDAHREQVFGALYTRKDGRLQRVEDEMVVSPGKFVDWVGERCGAERVAWVSPDTEHITFQEAWRGREKDGEKVQKVSAVFAPVIGKIGYQKLLENRTADAVTLDANYVRRSDAELLWKGGSGHGR
ncbi:MAG: tRNA (adenosine(37)-N6)-threonylcarbamoyltransferase complex dimerization subunit type 1 TsaB [Candidatus Acidiferrales bacterium]